MTGEHAVLYSIGLYCLAVLLPVVPAVVLFKLFPDTKVGVKGPLSNLSVKTTGAFAAYVVTAVLGFGFTNNVIRQIDQSASTTWTVDVPVKLIDINGRPIPEPATVSFVNFVPNLVNVGSDVVYVTVPKSANGQWPTVHFGLAGFSNGVLDMQQILGTEDEKIAKIDARRSRISVKRPVTLTALRQRFRTVEYQDAVPLEPIDVRAGNK